MENVTVFGGSKIDDKQYEEAYFLGIDLAEAGFVVVSGGYSGTMEAVSRGAESVDGPTLGVIFAGKPGNKHLSDHIHIPPFQFAPRKEKLFELGDAYIFINMKNSLGTGDEFFDAMVNLVHLDEGDPKIEKPTIIVGHTREEMEQAISFWANWKAIEKFYFVKSYREVTPLLKKFL